jgi:hypothetical protein
VTVQVLLTLVLVLFTTAQAEAGPKPVCFYSSIGAPADVICGSIGDMASDQAIEDAYQRSVTTGFRWILQMGDSDDPTIPAEKIALRDLKRFWKLMPYIEAVTYGQEWYEQCTAGVYSRYGLTPDNPLRNFIIYTWLGMQHAAVKKVMNRPVIWITTAVYSEQPVPLNTDIVSVDIYVQDGETTDWAEFVLRYAEIATDLPLVVTPRFFKNTGPKQGPGWTLASQDPTKEMVDMYLRIFMRKRYIAMWAFLWQSRPYADLVGLEDMPAIRDYFLDRLRVLNK